MLINLALRLLRRSYGQDPPYLRMVSEFYRDCRQVVLNCFTYNTEVTSLVAQAQRLLMALARHFQRWVLPSPPGHSCPLSEGCCDDHHCLLSGSLLNLQPPMNAIKCGRCAGMYCLDALYSTIDLREHNNHNNNNNPNLNPEIISTASFSSSEPLSVRLSLVHKVWDRVVAPTREQIDLSHEDWFFPFCLDEDSSILPSSSSSSIDSSSSSSSSVQKDQTFSLTEWGPSAFLPWLLHPTHSDLTRQLRVDQPHLEPILNALLILSRPYSSFVPPNPPNSTTTATTTTATATTNSGKSNSWTLNEHLTVLSGLVSVISQDPSTFMYIDSLRSECTRLEEVVDRPMFKDAEVMDIVRGLLGKEGEEDCRILFDGIANHHHQPHHHSILDSNGVITSSSSSSLMGRSMSREADVGMGRCIVCKGLTSEPPPDDDDDGNDFEDSDEEDRDDTHEPPDSEEEEDEDEDEDFESRRRKHTTQRKGKHQQQALKSRHIQKKKKKKKPQQKLSVLVCDGCSNEAHLSCLGLYSVLENKYI